MPELPPLTKRQQEVMHFIEATIAELGYPPTIREIGKHLGIRSTNGVVDHLNALKRKGYLTKQDWKSRALTPTASAASKNQSGGGANDNVDTTLPVLVPGTNESVTIPILGRVAAGEPILAEEDAEGTVVVDSMLVGKGKKLFALKVVGESMIDDGIKDGDYIFVQKRASVDEGAIAVVMVENEATVKRIYFEKDRVRLQPANATMEPIYINRSDFRQTQVIGLVVGVYRKMPD